MLGAKLAQVLASASYKDSPLGTNRLLFRLSARTFQTAYAPHDRLRHLVGALCVGLIGEAKLGPGACLANSNGQVSAKLALHIRSFVSSALCSPSEHTNPGKVARLALAAAYPGHKILRLVAIRIGPGVEQRPGNHAPSNRAGVITNWRRRVEFNESRQHPAGDRDRRLEIFRHFRLG